MKLAVPPRPMMMWSWTAMRRARAASTTSRVISMSARLGVGYVPFLAMGPVRLTFRLPKPKRPTPITIGDHVRARRLDLGFTLAEAGEAMGICWNAIMRWEGGSRVPGVTTLPAVIHFLGYDPRPEPRAFAEWLRWLRGTLGLHQPEMAVALGVATGSLHAWEKKVYCLVRLVWRPSRSVHALWWPEPDRIRASGHNQTEESYAYRIIPRAYVTFWSSNRLILTTRMLEVLRPATPCLPESSRIRESFTDF